MIREILESIDGDYVLDTVEDVENLIATKSKEYGSKNKFLASDEYKKLYPKIEQIYKKAGDIQGDKFQKAMADVEANYGDRVEYASVSPWGIADVFIGTIINRNNLPYVKLDKKAQGRTHLKWHKGWKKVD